MKNCKCSDYVNILIPKEWSPEKQRLVNETLAEIKKEYSSVFDEIHKHKLEFVATCLCIHAINIYSRKVRENMKKKGIVLDIKELRKE